MSSQQQAGADSKDNNRRGPITAAGKAKSRANALRHGLAATVLAPPALRDDVEALAKAIAGDADPSRLALAREIAAAQLDWMRVQVAKVALMNAEFVVASPATRPGAVIAERSQEARPDEPDDLPNDTAPPENLLLAPSIHILHQLARLERYEQRALARHRRATRRLLFFGSG